MSLIDRVAQRFGEGGGKAPAMRRPAPPTPAAPRAPTPAPTPSPGVGASPRAKGPLPDLPDTDAPAFRKGVADDGPVRTSQEFSLDFSRLRELGYITPYNRRSRVSEEVRLIKRRLMQRMTLPQDGHRVGIRRGREHVILVTSSRPSEGKSFIAVNLALSIVLDEGFNVLLVDSDVARPSLRRLLDIKAGPGLTDLLRSDPPALSDVLMREKNHPLAFLGAGNAVASATDLFGGARMKALIDDIADRYTDRIIVFDAPPLLASTEPVVLAQHVGQIVFVVDAGRTSRNAVESALELLDSQDNVNLILNRTTSKHRLEQFGTYYDAYNAGEEIHAE